MVAARCALSSSSYRAGFAAGFVEWFHKRTETNDEPAMLAAHPEHYIISTLRRRSPGSLGNKWRLALGGAILHRLRGHVVAANSARP
jgi:hypothetical protein